MNGLPNVAWNLTFGLYWIRPWSFLSLDQKSQVYLTHKLGLSLGLNGPKKRCDAADYCAAMDTLEPLFQESSYPVHSYPELSLEAWIYRIPDEGTGRWPYSGLQRGHGRRIRIHCGANRSLRR